MTVSSIALSQTGPINERQLALLDYNRDLYVVTVKDSKPKFVKLGEFMISYFDNSWKHFSDYVSTIR